MGAAAPAFAAPTAEEIENASFDGAPLPEGQSALTAKVQILLDRAGISPGVIDGYKGGMSETAIRAFEERQGLEVDGLLDEQVWVGIGGDMAQEVTGTYTITAEDTEISGTLPDDFGEMAELDWLGYERVSERIAERFHMDEDFLIALNPDAAFAEGDELTVVQPGERLSAEVARITVSGADRRLRAYGADGAMIASYPVAVGSTQTPSPSGTHSVEAVAMEPTYSYRPDVNFQQGDNTEPLTIPPGPNGPVGLVWIDLSEPTYGIHGTPRPARLFVENSNGCVRMTNWDAEELAHMVSTGIEVEFLQ